MIYLVLECNCLRIDEERFLSTDSQETSHGRGHVCNHVCIDHDLVIGFSKIV